jgi:Tol biopolymer transport system component
MIDDRDALERTQSWFHPEPGIVKRVYRRRERKQRNERIGAAVIALVLVAGPIGLAASSFRKGPVTAHPGPSTQSRIVFVSHGEGQPGDRLYTVAPNGNGVRRLADVYAEYPALSPDGTTVAFDSGAILGSPDWSKGRGHVYTVGIDDGGVRQITTGKGSEFAPSWSPDGTHLAVAASEPGAPPGIAVVDVATGAVDLVTKNPYAGYFDKEPDYAPDGTRIVFVRQRALVERGAARNLAALFVVNVDGSDLRQLTPWVDSVGTPKWSPDGRRIVFRGGCCVASPDQGGALMQLFIISASGGQPRQLTTDPFSSSYWPSWSPDGTRIVFTRYTLTQGEPPPQRLFTMRADGTDVSPLMSRVIEQNEATWGIVPTQSLGGNSP